MNKTNKKFRFCIIFIVILIIISLLFLSYRFINRKELATIQNNTTNINNTNKKDNTDTIFKIKNVKCSKGQEINIEIELLKDSDFVAANFEYNYDSINLEYNNYEKGNSLNDEAMTIVNNDKKNDKVLIGFVANPEGEKIIKAGKLLILKFKVKDNITINRINNKFDCTTLKKENGEDIKFTIQQGKIEIN